jgi:hypothetical protein
MTEAYDCEIKAPTMVHTEAIFDARRSSVVPLKATALIRTLQNQDIKNQLRLIMLQPPHPTKLNSHRVKQDAISDWRSGFQAGIECALRLLNGSVLE